MHLHHLKEAVLLAPLLLCAASASAQYSPDASMDLGTGYGATALGSATLDGTRRLGTDGGGSDELSPTMKRYCAQWPNEGVCRADRERAAQRQQQAARPSQARMNELMAQLMPEYEQRVRQDGKASADQWLRETAFRLGQQDGRAARQRQP
jgi:hypothetical protein